MSDKAIPEEVKGLNWGAFLLSFIWGIFNKTYISFLVIVPFLNIVIFILLLIKGNEWAWKNREWESIDQFKMVQKEWTRWGVIITLVLIAVIFLLPVFSAFLLPIFLNI